MSEQSLLTEIKYICKAVDEIKSEIKDFRHYCDEKREDCNDCNENRFARKDEVGALKELINTKIDNLRSEQQEERRKNRWFVSVLVIIINTIVAIVIKII